MNSFTGRFLTIALAAMICVCKTATMTAASPPNGDSSSSYKKFLTTERVPEYPAKARQEHLTGSCVVGLQINSRTGGVTSARILKTTGHKILDDAALKACRGFGFMPDTITQAEVPVTFASSGAWFPSYNTPADPVALFAPPPELPGYLSDQKLNATGTAVIEVDHNSGLVTAARMQPSTGNQILDKIALRAFRQWRFKPDTIKECKIRVRFGKDFVRSSVLSFERVNSQTL